jgi:hypothetical protein
MQTAHADTLRCGSSLIETGDSSFRVVDKCGEPASKTTLDEPIFSQDAHGRTYQSGSVRSELWRYNFGSQKFPATVKITNGTVRSITFEKT